MNTGLSDADELRLLRLFLAADSVMVERNDDEDSVMYRAPWRAQMRMGEGFAAVTSPGQGRTRALAMVQAAMRYEQFIAEHK